MEWQPIETARMDGSKMDLFQNGERKIDAYWSDLQGSWCVDGRYGPEEPTPLAVFPKPTHWMKVTPPSETVEG